MQASGNRASVRGSSSGRSSAVSGRELVEAWRASGKTAAQFCRDRGVAPHRLHYWKKRIGCAEDASASGRPEFFALDLSGPVRAQEAGGTRISGAEGIRIRVARDVQVELPAGSDRELFIRTLRWIVEAMRS